MQPASASSDDEYLAQCIEVMRQEGRASVSLFQRRLRLGYVRAKSIMGILEQRGIVAPHLGAESGAAPREILRLPPIESARQKKDTQRAIGLFAKPSKASLALNSFNPQTRCVGCDTDFDLEDLQTFKDGPRCQRCSGREWKPEKRSGEKPARNLDAPKLNKTEQRWQDAHPEHIAFPLSLRWGKCMSYKPDFMEENQPLMKLGKPILIEVKGAHVYSRDIVRFKGCAAEWGWLFSFEMWQWKDSKWSRLY